MNVVKRDAGDRAHLVRLAEATGDLSLLASFTEKRPSVQERLASGKALREKVPRADHGRFDKNPDRADPVAILEQQNVSRVQKLVPVRFARMLASPFGFLRGSAAIMAGISPVRRLPACSSTPAATCTSPISGSLPRPNATSCSRSMISTRSIRQGDA